MFAQCGLKLSPKPMASDGCIVAIDVHVGTKSSTVYLPMTHGLSYFVLSAGSQKLTVVSQDFEQVVIKTPLGVALRMWCRLILKRQSYLRFADCVIVPRGPRESRRIFLGVARRMQRTGTALDGPQLTRYPELLTGWSSDSNKEDWNGDKAPGLDKAVVLHIYYDDILHDIRGALSRTAGDFDLIVTTVSDRPGLVEKIRRSFPSAEIRVFCNKGRDIRPFLSLLEQGRLDRYKYVCKLHGKKSSDGGRNKILGTIWRNRMFFDLIAGPNVFKENVERFEREPTLGLIGPRVYRYPSILCSEMRSWGSNRESVLRLVDEMGSDKEKFRLDFFCGTMFWVRPEALKPLRMLRLSERFEDESGRIDGGLEHAVERLFTHAASIAGYRYDDVDACRLRRTTDSQTPTR